jgi:hypothetical protein
MWLDGGGNGESSICGSASGVMTSRSDNVEKHHQRTKQRKQGAHIPISVRQNDDEGGNEKSRMHGKDGGTVIYIESQSCISVLCVIALGSDGTRVDEHARTAENGREHTCIYGTKLGTGTGRWRC